MATIPRSLQPLLGVDPAAVTPEQLERLLGEPETQQADWKRQLGNSNTRKLQLAAEVAGFANATGGLIVLGLEQNDRGEAATYVGVSGPALPDYVDWVSTIIRDRISPVPPFSVHGVKGPAGTEVVLIAVDRSKTSPHAVIDGSSLRYPVRNGTGKRYLSASEVPVPQGTVHGVELADLVTRPTRQSRIWYVDDDTLDGPLVVARIREALPRARVVYFSTPEIFVEDFTQHGAGSEPAVVVTELFLDTGPGDAGTSVDRIVQAVKSVRDIPVVGFTLHQPLSTHPKLDLIVDKAFGSDELISQISAILERQSSGQGTSDAEPTRPENGRDEIDAPAGEDGTVPTRNLASVLTLVDRPDPEALGLLAASTEQLIGAVRHHLQEGTWSPQNGYEYGVEEDLEGDLGELERQLRSLSGRPPNMAIVQGHVTDLSQALMEVAQRESGPEARDRLETLRTQVIDKLSHSDGSVDDIGDAIDALEALSYETSWADVEPPDTASDADWDEFVSFASDHRGTVAETIVGWTPVNRQEAAGAVIGAMTVAGGIGFLASSVATWVGASTAGAAGLGTIIGLVGAVVGAVLGVLATRFVPRDAETPPEY